MGHPGAIEDIKPFAELAQNATTVVYKAYQASLERFVLLKRLRLEYSHDEDLAARFQEEARIAARVQHPNVVSVYAFGRDEEGAYIVAEFVEGVDLGALVQRSKIPPDLALFILHEAALGLKAAHDKDVLHRDLKPANILVSRDGEVKLSDFGLASVSDTADGSPSEVRGTLAYLAPEQILENGVDERSDLFSLGATFFEMLTGRRAFPGTGSKEIFDAILNRDPLPFVKATAGVDDEIAALCSRLLARDPADRFRSAGALVDAVDVCRQGRFASVDAASLSAFLDDPEAFDVAPKPEPKLVPDVRIVPEDGEKETKHRKSRRVRRTAVISAAALVIVAAIVYAGVTAMRPSGLDADPAEASRDQPDSAAVDAARQAAMGMSLAVDTASDSDIARDDPASIPDEPLRDAAPADVSQDAEPSPPAPGYVTVFADTTASVFAGSDSVGFARPNEPLTFSLPPGDHTIATRNAVFPILERSVTVDSGDTTVVDVSLWETVGRLRLTVWPWADVYVDGRYRGQTPIRPWLVLLPGVHDLRLIHPIHGEHTTTVTIPRGEVVSREFSYPELN